MPKITEPLKDLQVKNAKPQDKPYKLADGGGVLAGQASRWEGVAAQISISRDGKMLSLGTYPEVGLQERAANTFEAVAREWLSKNKDGWAKGHYEKIVGRLEHDVFPYLGDKPISTITAPDLLNVVRKIESRGVVETAHRALANCGQIFRYAVATGRTEHDLSDDLRGALPSVKSRRTHFSAVTDPKEVGELLRALNGYEGTPTVCAALALPRSYL